MKNNSSLKKITGSREFLLAIIVLLLFIVVSIRNPAFFTFESVTGMLKNNAVAMVMALGMLCVMLVGGIDISITSTLALAGMSIGMLLKYNHISSTLLTFIIAMAIGLACGAVIGVIIAYADVVLAFWDGQSRGTKYVIDHCREQHVPVRVFAPRKK